MSYRDPSVRDDPKDAADSPSHVARAVSAAPNTDERDRKRVPQIDCSAAAESRPSHEASGPLYNRFRQDDAHR